MKYLLDVNALVALGFLQHQFHERVAAWVRTSIAKGTVELGDPLDYRAWLCPNPCTGAAVGICRFSSPRPVTAAEGGNCLDIYSRRS